MARLSPNEERAWQKVCRANAALAREARYNEARAMLADRLGPDAADAVEEYLDARKELFEH